MFGKFLLYPILSQCHLYFGKKLLRRWIGFSKYIIYVLLIIRCSKGFCMCISFISFLLWCFVLVFFPSHALHSIDAPCQNSADVKQNYFLPPTSKGFFSQILPFSLPIHIFHIMRPIVHLLFMCFDYLIIIPLFLITRP